MPFIGIGLHIFIAIFFAIHAVRTGRDIYWLLILFMFPLLGSIVYLFTVYLPDTRIQHTFRKTVTSAVRTIDPGKELREARNAFDMTPTAQNKMRLAAALLETGSYNEAAEYYEACLKGPLSDDPEIRLGAARARLLSGHSDTAVELLELIRVENRNYRSDQVTLLLAQAYGKSGRYDDAKREFTAAVTRYGNIEARVEYGLWALERGDQQTANEQYHEVAQSMKHWTKHARSLNKPMVDRLEVALSAAGKA
jgi:hypothetical protein